MLLHPTQYPWGLISTYNSQDSSLCAWSSIHVQPLRVIVKHYYPIAIQVGHHCVPQSTTSGEWSFPTIFRPIRGTQTIQLSCATWSGMLKTPQNQDHRIISISVYTVRTPGRSYTRPTERYQLTQPSTTNDLGSWFWLRIFRQSLGEHHHLQLP